VTGSGLRYVAGVLALGLAAPAGAIDFEFTEGVNLKMVNKFTIGAGIRTQDPEGDSLGILNVPGQQPLCAQDDCLSFGVGAGNFNPEPNQRLVDATGGHFLHASDDGSMNYHNGEFYTAISKLNADWTLNWGEWTFKTNFVGYFDSVNAGFATTRFNTVRCTGANPSQLCTGTDGPNNSPDSYLLGPDERPRSGEIEQRLGVRGEFREYFVTRSFMFGDYEIFATLGNQRLRWGEANLTPLNTLDVINPQDAVLARQPGLALNELNLPTGLLNIGSDIAEGISIDAWYEYAWEPVRPEPAGSFFSNLTDAAGGGSYAVIALGQYPEDPDALYFSQGVTGLISNSHRTIYIPPERTHAPEDGGQYGLRMKWYLPNFNNGTELGFYYANYHSRLPYASVYAAQNSCLREALTFAEAANLCDGFNAASNRGQANPGDMPGNPVLMPQRCDPRGCNMGAYLAREPLPIDTMGVFLDFPEDIQMYGVSFNTTFGGWSFAGEYAFRPNLPAQLLLSDVVFAALQPVVGRVTLPFTGLTGGPFIPDPLSDSNTGARVGELLADFGTFGDPTAQNSALPAANVIFPSYVADYRGYNNASDTTDIDGGQYIAGYERLKVGQFALTALQLFSTNPFGSDDLLMVYEVGFTHVVDMPKTTGSRPLFFQGAGDQTHPSEGADGTGGTGQPGCRPGACEGRINPTQQTKGFAEDFAWGLRALVQLNYSNLFDVGLTVKPTVLAFWDVDGIAPSPMQNYTENSRWLVPALFFEYGAQWSGTLIYQYFDGRYSALNDRDNVSFSLTYAF
jgi:hypothetical protein